ncbi:hypothetical protein V8Z74_19405 [Comamonas sp. w2-DMI]|uniref:hypothetical protein n=1 Tax=Comamonas sp. w2-DMI TaxID=3126391 RepID=UPI0032E4B9A2
MGQKRGRTTCTDMGSVSSLLPLLRLGALCIENQNARAGIEALDTSMLDGSAVASCEPPNDE